MRGLRRSVGRRVVVVTGFVQARGVVRAVSGGCLLLEDAVAVEQRGDVKVDGGLLVPVSRIEYVQVLA